MGAVGGQARIRLNCRNKRTNLPDEFFGLMKHLLCLAKLMKDVSNHVFGKGGLGIQSLPFGIALPMISKGHFTLEAGNQKGKRHQQQRNLKSCLTPGPVHYTLLRRLNSLRYATRHRGQETDTRLVPASSFSILN